MSSAKFSLNVLLIHCMQTAMDDIKTVNVVRPPPKCSKRIERGKRTSNHNLLKQLRFVMRQYDFNFIEMDMWDVPNED